MQRETRIAKVKKRSAERVFLGAKPGRREKENAA